MNFEKERERNLWNERWKSVESGALKKLLRGTLCEELLKGTSERMFWKDYREELLKITFERNFEETVWKELLKGTFESNCSKEI